MMVDISDLAVFLRRSDGVWGGVVPVYKKKEPFQPTEVTNRPLNINLIKIFRSKNVTQKESKLLWLGNIWRKT